MSNEEILNKRWENTDKYLKDYLLALNILSEELIDKIIDVFNSLDVSYQDLNKPISKYEKRKLDRKIKEWKKRGLLVGYFGYLILSKKKYTLANLLEILVYSIYIEFSKSIKDSSKELYKNIAQDTYYQGINDLPLEVKKPKKTPLEWEFIYSLLWIPTYNKHLYDYFELLTMTNYQETYKQLLAYKQQDKKVNSATLKELVKKQTNRFLSIKDGKYSGVLSDVSREVGNSSYLKSAVDNDLQVRFIAEMDDKTTRMCDTLNNQLFYVNRMNVYTRYSEIDKRIVTYHTHGLVVGENLPPINNHFHWCRSTITYLK